MIEVTIQQIDKELLEDLRSFDNEYRTEAMTKFYDLLMKSKSFNDDTRAFCVELALLIFTKSGDEIIPLVRELSAKYFAHGYNIAISQMVKDE